MRMLIERALALSGVLLVLFVVGQGGSTEAMVVSVAVIAFAAVAALQLVALIAPSRPAAGTRAASRRTLTASEPEPSHPRTAGRPLSRAPGAVVAAA